jgi:hypothetical protein
MFHIATLSLVLASALVLTSTPTAGQAPAAATAITITGCVAAAQRDGSTGAKATGTAATPETAATEANNPEPTGKFMLLDASTAGSKEAVAAPDSKPAKPAQPLRSSYALRGQEQEVAKHVGHRVQITGTLLPPLAVKLPEKTAATAEGIRAVQVTAVKMMGTDCSARGQK